MTAVRIPASWIDAMERHARATYPDECCGFLIASEAVTPEGTRVIEAVEPAPNEFEGERRRRFVIRPDELRTLERRLERTGRAVVGFYHSHPDHPVSPSSFDEQHAWPWYTYLVLSVTASAVSAIGAFELDGDSGRFHEVPLDRSPGVVRPVMTSG